MDFNILSVVSEHVTSTLSLDVVKCLIAVCIFIIIWRTAVYLYGVAIGPLSIHYITHKRKSLQITTSYNPFIFEANYTSASFAGIKCSLKSYHQCYVQAFWGVPIFHLFELLNRDWESLIHAVNTYVPGEKFSSKCVGANDPFRLADGEEKTIEFKPPWCANEAMLLQEATHMREVYPFVVLMVLIKTRDELPEPFVIAMANAVHVPDKNLLLYPQLIGQYLRTSCGNVGQIKKIFLSSPATSDDGGDRYDLCLACYHRPVSMVFLPCRHACLCRACFDLCERCPVCRAASFCFFELPNFPGDDH